MTSFEDHTWALLVIAVIEVHDGVEKAVIKEHTLYSYEIVRRAALETQQSAQFLNDQQVQDFQFSNKWVRGFLNREKMRKRRITSVEKEIPSVNEVRQQMSIGQSLIICLMLLAYQIWNMDETAFTWAIGPQHAFVSEEARRAAGEQSNTKQRIS